jgi:hypothetical protein
VLLRTAALDRRLRQEAALLLVQTSAHLQAKTARHHMSTC